MEIISLRLDKIKELDSFGRLLQQNRSSIVRELLEEGKKMKAIKLYREKKISLGLGAKLSGMCLSDFLDLLEEYNVKLNLALEDAKIAMKNADELI